MRKSHLNPKDRLHATKFGLSQLVVRRQFRVGGPQGNRPGESTAHASPQPGSLIFGGWELGPGGNYRAPVSDIDMDSPWD